MWLCDGQAASPTRWDGKLAARAFTTRTRRPGLSTSGLWLFALVTAYLNRLPFTAFHVMECDKASRLC